MGKYLLKVRVISGELVAMGEQQLFTWSQDKQPALLPEVARAPALAKSFFF